MSANTISISKSTPSGSVATSSKAAALCGSPLSVFWEYTSQRLSRAVDSVLSQCDDCAPSLVDAMRYATLNGGKRLRPTLVYAVAEIFNAQGNPYIDAIAVAIEFVHSYSLVHDDLPAMDDDDLRRGLPTCHKAFDEATAILAGDALQTLAFEVLARDYSQVGNGAQIFGDFTQGSSDIICDSLMVTSQQQVEVIRVLAVASGTAGMAAGQSLDLGATGQTLGETEIRKIHELKTGCLIAASMEMAAISIIGISAADKKALKQFGTLIGLAFQIRDDILDEIGDTRTMGKTVGADANLHKATYPSVMSVEAAQQLVQTLYVEAMQALSLVSVNTTRLQQIAAFLTQRTN